MDGILGWIDALSDFVDPITAGVFATVFALVVGMINLVFRRWLTAGQMGLLWGFVLLRLLIPVGPGSSLSLESLINGTFEYFESATELEETSAASGPIAAPRNHPHVERDAMQAAVAQREAIEQVDIWHYVLTSLPAIWFVVGFSGLVFTLVTYSRFRRRVGRVPACADSRLLAIWSECCRTAGVCRRTRLVVFDGVEQPAIMGVFRPTLLLPLDAEAFTNQQLRLVMLHELAHVRRWDIAANWLLVLIRAIHWWNPIYWLAAARFRSLQEQACDAFVVRQMAGEPVRDYRELLLTLAERRPAAAWRVSLPASILGFFPSWFRRRSLAVRLRALPSAGIARSRWQVVAALVLIVPVATSGLTNEKLEERWYDLSQSDQPVRAMRVSDSYDARPKYDGPRVSRTYDVRVVLDRMAGQWKISRTAEPDKVKRLLTSLLEISVPVANATPQNAAVSDITAARAVEGSPLKFEVVGDQIIVEAPVEVHELVARSLSVWAESGFGQITVTSRIVRANRDLAAEAGISWEHFEAVSASRLQPIATDRDPVDPLMEVEHRVEEYQPVAVAKLDEKQATELIAVAQGNRRANVLNAPKVTIFNGQEAIIADCTQCPFVIGVNPIVGEQAVAMQPKIEIIEEGTKITLRAIQSPDMKTIRLKQRMDMCSVGEVETATASVHGQEVTIQIPQVERHVLNVDTEIKNGQTLLVGCLPTGEKREYQYYLLTVENIEE
jgi:bla regulator protein BlaR1